MPENDIYNSQRKYENFVDNAEQFLIPIEKRKNTRGKAVYHYNNKENLKYFYKLFDKFEARDLGYIRRNRLLCHFRFICHHAEKDLKYFDRDDIDTIVARMHKTHKSPISKADFIKNIKRIWRLVLPERDEKGRWNHL